MEIIVEIGTMEQKQTIINELKIIEPLLDIFDPPLNLKKVIVPIDFIKTINQIQNTNSFHSDRGQEQIVAAKTIELSESCILVFSPTLYTEGYDNQIRMAIYLHELIHAINYRKIPQSIAKSFSYSRLFSNLYILYDEYYANRKSFEITDCIYPNKSKIFTKFIKGGFNGHLQSLINNGYYEKIKSEIRKFRIDGNIVLFLKEVTDIFDAAAKAIVYSYSYIDHFDFAKKQVCLIDKSNFINEKTKSLVDFYRKNYLEDNFDLISGVNLMENFLINFGMKFEDLEDGEYCHVIDI